MASGLPIPCSACTDAIQKCPFCHCACELVAKTINTDEDAFCDRCQKDCFQAQDGSLVKDDPSLKG